MIMSAEPVQSTIICLPLRAFTIAETMITRLAGTHDTYVRALYVYTFVIKYYTPASALRKRLMFFPAIFYIHF